MQSGQETAGSCTSACWRNQEGAAETCAELDVHRQTASGNAQQDPKAALSQGKCFTCFLIPKSLAQAQKTRLPYKLRPAALD